MLNTKSSQYLLIILLLSLIVLLSLCVGAKAIPLTVVYDSLWGNSQHPDSIIVLQSRLPRTLLGLIAGASLGLSGEKVSLPVVSIFKSCSWSASKTS